SYTGGPNGLVAVNFATLRLNPDGTLDTTFSGDGIDIRNGTDAAKTVAIQSDGKIVVGGADYYLFVLVRYNPDGTLDTTFDRDGKVITRFPGSGWDQGREIIVSQTDGKILVAGLTSDLDGNHVALARYYSDGSPDSSFGVGGKVTTAVGFFTLLTGPVVEP